jgi:hypothetical protein
MFGERRKQEPALPQSPQSSQSPTPASES